MLDKAHFNIEVTFSDNSKTKKRLIFSGSQQYDYSKDNISRQPLHARIPSAMILEGVWLNLQIDVQSYVENTFEDANFRSIDSVVISGPALVRKVVTCKAQVPDSFPFVIEREFGPESAQGYEEYIESTQRPGTLEVESLAQNLEFGTGVDHMNQVLSFDRLVYFGYIYERAGLHQKNAAALQSPN